MPTFTDKNNQQTIENNPDKGITATIANYIPMATLLFEQVTGTTIPQSKGTLADILVQLQELKAKIAQLEKTIEELRKENKELKTKLAEQEKGQGMYFDEAS